MVKNPPSIRALTTGLVSSRFSSCSGEAAAITGRRSRAFWTCGWMVGIAFLRLRGDAVPMDNSFAPRPGQESHTSGTACRLCWVRIPPLVQTPPPRRGSAFAYSHYHWDGHCGMVAEDATSLDPVDVGAVYQERALFWGTTACR